MHSSDCSRLPLFPESFTRCTPGEAAARRDAAKLLAERLRRAVLNRERFFRVPPGEYSFSGGEALLIDGAENLWIEAEGATFWFTPGAYGVHFRNCRNVRLSGLTCDLDELPFLQGTLETVTPEMLSVRLDREFAGRFRRLPAGLARFRVMFLDADGTAETDHIDFRPEIAAIQADGEERLRIPVGDDVAAHWLRQIHPPRPGDRVALGMRQSGGMVLADGCEGMVFEDISVFAAAGFAFFETGFGGGGNCYRRCRLIRRPGSGRLLAGAADCFHSLNQKRGPRIESCEFSWAMDDLVNIHGFFLVVLEVVAPDEWIVAAPFGVRCEPGTALTVYAPPYGDEKGTAHVAAVSPLADTGDFEEKVRRFYRDRFGIELRDFGGSRPCRVRLDRASGAVAPFDLVASYDSCGAGARLTGNRLHDGHVRGILVKSRDCRIENNTIERIALSGIILKPELYWLEGPMPKQIRIAGNRLIDCAFGHTGIAAIVGMSGFCPPPGDRFTPAVNQQEIEIAGNWICGCHAGPGILLANCRAAQVVDNKLEHLYSNPAAPTAALLAHRLDRAAAPVAEPGFAPAGVQFVAARGCGCARNPCEAPALPEYRENAWCE